MQARIVVILFTLLAVPSVALVTKPKQHPADATTIAGVDCNHVKSIIGKWTKATKVGSLMGAAKAMSDAANEVAANADKAADAALAVGLKVGLGGVAPSSVADAVGVARNASIDLAAKVLTLGETTLATKAAMAAAHFADKVSSKLITKITEQTHDVVVATSDVNIAASRATKKAAEAKDDALKNSKGALNMIKGVLSNIANLTKKVVAMQQRIGVISKDVKSSLGKSAKKSTFMKGQLMAYITSKSGAREQAPVWQARYDAVFTLHKTLSKLLDAVNKANSIMNASKNNMTAEEKTLKGVASAAQSSESAALGQAENLAKAEQTIRSLKTAFDICKHAVSTMMITGKQRLDDKYLDTEKRLAKHKKMGKEEHKKRADAATKRKSENRLLEGESPATDSKSQATDSESPATDSESPAMDSESPVTDSAGDAAGDAAGDEAFSRSWRRDV